MGYERLGGSGTYNEDPERDENCFGGSHQFCLLRDSRAVRPTSNVAGEISSGEFVLIRYGKNCSFSVRFALIGDVAGALVALSFPNVQRGRSFLSSTFPGLAARISARICAFLAAASV